MEFYCPKNKGDLSMKNTGETQVKKLLPLRQHQLLFRLVNSLRKQSCKIFDKQDNCFQVTPYRGLAVLSGESKSSIARLFFTLRNEGLIKVVIDSRGEERQMLSPSFSCRGNKFEILFMQAMYALGSHELACDWSESCRKDHVLYNYETFNNTELVDFTTGEITYPFMVALRSMKDFEVKQWNCYRGSYSSTDRTKHRESKSA